LFQLFYVLSLLDNLNHRCNYLLTWPWFRYSQTLHSDMKQLVYHKQRCMCIGLTNWLSNRQDKKQCIQFLQDFRLNQDNLLLLVLSKHNVSKIKIILSSSSSFFFFLCIFSSIFLLFFCLAMLEPIPLFIPIAFSLVLLPATLFY